MDFPLGFQGGMVVSFCFWLVYWVSSCTYSHSFDGSRPIVAVFRSPAEGTPWNASSEGNMLVVLEDFSLGFA